MKEKCSGPAKPRVSTLSYLFPFSNIVEWNWSKVFRESITTFRLFTWWFSEDPFSCIYLKKSDIIITLSWLGTLIQIFLTNVECRTEQEQEDECDVDEETKEISYDILHVYYTWTGIWTPIITAVTGIWIPAPAK